MKRLACGLEQAQCRIAREFHTLRGTAHPWVYGDKTLLLYLRGLLWLMMVEKLSGERGLVNNNGSTVALWLPTVAQNELCILALFSMPEKHWRWKGYLGTQWGKRKCVAEVRLSRPLSHALFLVRPISLVHARVRETLPLIYRSDLCWKYRIYPPPLQCPHRRCHASGASGSPRS